MSQSPIVIAGASGFVGQHLVQALREQGRGVRCGTRDPDRAARREPDQDWVRLDLEDPGSLNGALRGAEVLVYLVHSLGAGHSDDLLEHEAALAERVRGAAAQAGLRRIVYLGGPAPDGPLSPHLQARRKTGEILRRGPTSTLELRASMIIGYGSESWRICRDLAFRLPIMVAPKWLKSRTQPIGIDDVVTALLGAIDDPMTQSAAFDLPGPETLDAAQILRRIASHAGFRPVMFPVPLLTPRLSSLWLQFVTEADYALARQLVDGFVGDLLCEEPGYWARLPQAERVPFDEAVRRALVQEPPAQGVMGMVEGLARRIGRGA
ncbi:MAG: NAD-dependent epimerase/dehydratase family protein [Deltaproteobacteria bacterium]|nr:MAG: NAD-dependent epimerase/dehydratase family protein [Deltaproteobacteria bacterium]